MRKFFYLLFIAYTFYGCGSSSTSSGNAEADSTRNKLPEPGAYVNDFEGVLTYDPAAEISSYNKLALLDSMISEFKQSTGNEIAIVTIANIKPYTTLKDYAIAIGNQWGVGDRDKDNGLVIVVSQARREIWIATGYGAEKIITDSICKSVIDEKILPQFKKGELFEGIQNGLNTIISIWTEYSQVSKDSIN